MLFIWFLISFMMTIPKTLSLSNKNSINKIIFSQVTRDLQSDGNIKLLEEGFPIVENSLQDQEEMNHQELLRKKLEMNKIKMNNYDDENIIKAGESIKYYSKPTFRKESHYKQNNRQGSKLNCKKEHKQYVPIMRGNASFVLQYNFECITTKQTLSSQAGSTTPSCATTSSSASSASSCTSKGKSSIHTTTSCETTQSSKEPLCGSLEDEEDYIYRCIKYRDKRKNIQMLKKLETRGIVDVNDHNHFKESCINVTASLSNLNEIANPTPSSSSGDNSKPLHFSNNNQPVSIEAQNNETIKYRAQHSTREGFFILKIVFIVTIVSTVYIYIVGKTLYDTPNFSYPLDPRT